jgi:hypothetical protein
VTPHQRVLTPPIGGFGREVGIFSNFPYMIRKVRIPTLPPTVIEGREVGTAFRVRHPDLPTYGAGRDRGSVCDLCM